MSAPTPSAADIRVGIIGLGYVGLPLAIAFSEHFPVVGYDIDAGRLSDLRHGVDGNGEINDHDRSALQSGRIAWTSDIEALRECNVFIVTVPTPVDAANHPDLSPLRAATSMVGQVMKKGATVIFESTVYPMTTEEICIPLLEAKSGLKIDADFHVGYSPERINPGDRQRQLTDIVKVTSGSSDKAAEFVDGLYRRIIRAGTHRAASLRVAEAAKVIENTQRDVNIALMNELAMMFQQMNIDTQDVLDAARTKWNFLDFTPGLVGGHCISVDPYYLTHKATSLGYHPELILAARRINNRMPIFVASDVVRTMASKNRSVLDSHILILGLAFKEGTNDLRNTKVADIAAELRRLGARVAIWDPVVDAETAFRETGETLTASPSAGIYDAVVLAVAHPEIMARADDFRAWLRDGGVVYDVKGKLDPARIDGRV